MVFRGDCAVRDAAVGLNMPIRNEGVDLNIRQGRTSHELLCLRCALERLVLLLQVTSFSISSRCPSSKGFSGWGSSTTS